MSRVPLPIVVLVVAGVVGVTWWRGTLDYDFLETPTATAIETAKARANAELARPADVFVIEREPEPAAPAPIKRPAPKPPAPPKPPHIDVSDPTSPAPLDAWVERRDLPAASFIELASRLESNAHLAWARVTWERVVDLSDASREDREIAVRGIARIRASMPPPAETPADAAVVKLAVRAPPDRVGLTRRAALEAAEALGRASDRTIRFEPAVTPGRPESAVLRVELSPPSHEGPAPSVSSEAPTDPEAIRLAILSSCFKLIGSTLATEESLAPISPPTQGEAPLDALSNRITRRAWAVYLGRD